MTAPRIPRVRRVQVVGLPRETANDSRWPSTMFVGELPKPYRPARRVHWSTGIALRAVAGLSIVAMAAAVAGLAYIATGVAIRVMDALGVGLLHLLGVI